MTDARLPGRWLVDPTIRTLGADRWTVFSWALMWSAEQGTDGLIPSHMLPLLHPSGATTKDAEALVSLGLWEVEGDGYRVREWGRTQSLAADVEHQRERNRRKQQAFRERARQQEDVTGYVTGESPRRGEAEERPGEAKPSEGDKTTRARTRANAHREGPDERIRRLLDAADALEAAPNPPPAAEWPVRSIPE
ncbi:hypothetical protein [Agromyces sp. GXS1127]|uniref:hypothetical protein n=1 Tax=Agromyces sp. GXS1127 TaxID=3424181 RepID=UPI003D319184